MRLYLLPISTKQSLIYCQRINRQLSNKQSYLDKITRKASTTWLGWEKADKGWKKKVTTYGNKLFQRLPHEEWGLKSIPPLSARRKAEELEGKEKVQVEYPKSSIEPDAVERALKTFGAKERQAFHLKWLYGSIIGMPISAPFALIPIMPNLPFIYLCFRALSHWRARSGSQHLEFLLENQLIKLSPSSILDVVYAVQRLERSLKKLDAEHKAITSSLETGSTSSNDSKPPAEIMLLSASSGRLIADCLDVPEIEQEIERAIHQIGGALEARKELEEEKQALAAATKKPEFE